MKTAYKRTRWNGRDVDEQRAVMERHLGRKLQKLELVHHRNGDTRDNRIENLQLVTHAEHAEEHHRNKHPRVKKCVVCGKSFTPSPTKRATKKTCSRKCRYTLTSMAQRKPSGARSLYRGSASPSEVAKRLCAPQAQAFVEAVMECV